MIIYIFDIVVLGGGSGGYVVVLCVSEFGKLVVLIEKDKVGGICLYCGCIFIKVLLYVVEVVEYVCDVVVVGVLVMLEGIDFVGVCVYCEGIVVKKFKGFEGLVKVCGIIMVVGFGWLNVDWMVSVGDDVYVGMDVVFVIGFYSCLLLGFEIGGWVFMSEQVLVLDVIFECVFIFGGGVIGVEFVSVWWFFGVEVMIIEVLLYFVLNEDIVLSKGLECVFCCCGIQYLFGVCFQIVIQDDLFVIVMFEDGKEFIVDYLLVVVGCGFVIVDFGFEEVGVILECGFVMVDEELCIGVFGLWVVGDIVFGFQFVYCGFQQGIVVVECIVGLFFMNILDFQILKVIYFSLEVVLVGVIEEVVIVEYGVDVVVVYEYNFVGNGKSEIIGISGFVKVVWIKEGFVVGVYLFGD